ncbi:MAG: hypothetical protein ACYS8I_00825 [Planctomycetota bacterium]|jgi:hypothetical protein
MTKRNPRSPREILSRFDDALRQKRHEGQSSVEDFSIFDVVETQKNNDGQASGTEAERRPPDRGKAEKPTANKKRPQARKNLHWRPSWEVVEAAQARQVVTDSAMNASRRDGRREQTNRKTKKSVSTDAARTKVGTIRRKVTRALLVALLVVLVLVVIQSFFVDIQGLLVERIVAGGSLRVKGILYDKGNSSALVNKRIVHEGDEISGAIVTKINRDSVEFEVIERWPRKGERRHITKMVYHQGM